MSDQTADRMKPMLILPPEMMSLEDMDLLRANGICVVVAKDPGSIRFIDPLPSAGSRSKIEQAAIQLSRKILNAGYWSTESTRASMTALYFDILMKGTPLDASPSQSEVEEDIYNEARIDELNNIAREEARAEKAAEKLTKKQAKEALAASKGQV